MSDVLMIPFPEWFSMLESERMVAGDKDQMFGIHKAIT